MINLISAMKLDVIGNVLMPCMFCEKIISVPKLLKTFPPDYQPVEFTPKAVCDKCSGEKFEGETSKNFKQRLWDSLNKISNPYLLNPELKILLVKIVNMVESKDVFNSQYPFLIITGFPGTGKTVIAKALCEVLKFKFIKSYDLYHSYRNEIPSLYSGKLCLDDIGKETQGHDRKHLTFELIDNRYDNHAHTIITTQMQIEQISDVYGKDFADRINQYSRFLITPETNWRKN